MELVIEDLIKKADEDIRDGEGKVKVSLNDKPQTVHLLEPHSFMLNIQKVIGGAGNKGKGEGTLPNGNPPGQTRGSCLLLFYYTC